MINIRSGDLFTGLIAGVAAGAIVILTDGLTQGIYGNNFTIFVPIFKALASFVVLLIIIILVLYKQDVKKPQKGKNKK